MPINYPLDDSGKDEGWEWRVVNYNLKR